MPCYDSRDHGPTEEELRSQQIATRLACMYCKSLEKDGQPIPDFAVEYWDDHKRQDRAREAQEKQDEVRAKARSRGLAKLTPEERKALGVK